MTAPLPDPLAWLARQLLGPHELLLIHHGELDAARSALTSSMRGYSGGTESFQVTGTRVRYRHAGTVGTVPVARLVTHAVGHHDPAVGEQLAAAYADYVQASIREYTLARFDRRYLADPAEMHRRADAATGASRHLDRCAQAWWNTPPAQTALFADADP